KRGLSLQQPQRQERVRLRGVVQRLNGGSSGPQPSLVLERRQLVRRDDQPQGPDGRIPVFPAPPQSARLLGAGQTRNRDGEFVADVHDDSPVLENRPHALQQHDVVALQEAAQHAPRLQSRRRSAGNSTTSRMLALSVRSMTRRSIPMPHPPAGGMPYSSARM